MPYPVAAVRGKIQTPPPTNLYLLQDNFDTDINDWTEGSPTIAWNADNFHLASGSLALVCGGGAHQSVVVPGGISTVTVRFWAKGSEGGDFYCSFGVPYQNFVIVDADWHYYEADFPTGGGNVLDFSADAYNDLIYFDEITVKIKN